MKLLLQASRLLRRSIVAIGKVGHADAALPAVEGTLIDTDFTCVPRRVSVSATTAEHTALFGGIRQPLPIDTTTIIVASQSHTLRYICRVIGQNF